MSPTRPKLDALRVRANRLAVRAVRAERRLEAMQRAQIEAEEREHWAWVHSQLRMKARALRALVSPKRHAINVRADEARQEALRLARVWKARYSTKRSLYDAIGAKINRAPDTVREYLSPSPRRRRR